MNLIKTVKITKKMLKFGVNKTTSKLVSMLAVLFIVSCGYGGNPECIESNDFGEFNTKEVIVNAKEASDNNGWTYTGLKIRKQSDLNTENILTIQTKQGEVSLCQVQQQEFTNLFKNNNGGQLWQDTGIYIQPNTAFKIDVQGDWAKFKRQDPPISFSQNPEKTPELFTPWQPNGIGIYAFIGNSQPANSFSGVAGNISDYDPEIDTDPGYLSLSGGVNAGILAKPDQETSDKIIKLIEDIGGGNLYIKYDDLVNTFGDNVSRNDHKITITYLNSQTCFGEKGQYLVGYIGDNPPSNASINLSDNSIINLDNYSEGDDSATPNVPAGYYSNIAPKSGKLWLKILDSTKITWSNGKISGDGIDQNNVGQYFVRVSAPKKIDGVFSGLINNLIEPLRLYLLGGKIAVNSSDGGIEYIEKSGVAERMYKGVVANLGFIQAIRALVALAIVFFALAYMAGITEVKQKEFIHFTIKIAIVLALTSNQSWEFFYNHLFSIFINGIDDMIFLLTSQFNPPSSLGADAVASDAFRDMSTSLALFFSKETQSKVNGLFYAQGTGFLMFFLIWIGMLIFFFTVLLSILKYMQAIILIALLLILSPVFISFIIFGFTKDVYNKWIKSIFGYAVQPIFLFVFLSVFNAVIYSFFKQILDFDACWRCIWWSDWPFSEIFSFGSNRNGNWDLYCVSNAYTPWGGTGTDGNDPFPDNPDNIVLVLTFIILCHSLYKIMTFVEAFALKITSGIAAPSLSATSTEMAGRLSEAPGDAMRLTSSTLKSYGSLAKGVNNAIDYGGIGTIGKKVFGTKTSRPSTFLNNKFGSKMRINDGMGGKRKLFGNEKEKRAKDKEVELYNNLTREEQETMDKYNKYVQNAIDNKAEEADELKKQQAEEFKIFGKEEQFFSSNNRKIARQAEEAYKAKLERAKTHVNRATSTQKPKGSITGGTGENDGGIK